MLDRLGEMLFVVATGGFLGVAFEARRAGNKERFTTNLWIGLLWLVVDIVVLFWKSH
jgi:hypothetical protein